MVVVEGVARSLDEDANIWEISKPVLQGWLNNEIGPKNRIDKIENEHQLNSKYDNRNDGNHFTFFWSRFFLKVAKL